MKKSTKTKERKYFLPVLGLSLSLSFLCQCRALAVLKELPPNSPMFYYHIAKASLIKSKTHKERYFQKYYGNRVEVLEEKKFKEKLFSDWRMFLYRDKETTELLVGFSATRNTGNWIANFTHQVAEPAQILKKMKKKIKRWEEKYGNITTFVGHSAGGYFTSHVYRSANVFRITFNGHMCDRGHDTGGGSSKVLNLRLSGDKVSEFPISVSERYITLPLLRGTNSHHIKRFALNFAANREEIDQTWLKPGKTATAEKHWCEIVPSVFQGCLDQ